MEIVFETVQTPTAFNFRERLATEKLRYTLNVPMCKAHLDLELKHSGGKCEMSVHSTGKLGFVKLFEFSAFSSWIADKKHPEMYREEFVSRKRFRHWHVTSAEVQVEVHNPKESPSTEKFSYHTPTQGVWDPLALFFVLKQRTFKKIGDSMALSILSKRGPLYAVARAVDEKRGRLRIQVQALQGPAGENFELLERKTTEIWYDPELGEIAEIVVDAPVMGRLRIVRAESL